MGWQSTRRRSGLWGVIAVAGALLAVIPAVATADIIRVRADYWCPYNCAPEDPRPGYMVELVARALAAIGHVTDYQLMPWDRALEEVADGRIDAVVGATLMESQGLVLSLPLGRDHDCFFVRRDSGWTYRGPASLGEILLGVVAGYTHDEGPIDAYIAANRGPGGTVIAARGDEGAEKNVGLLLLGRVDAILDSEAVIRFVAMEAGRANEIKPAGCLAPLTLHMAIFPRRADSEELAAALARQVEVMRADGSLAVLLAEYGLTDWQ